MRVQTLSFIKVINTENLTHLVKLIPAYLRQFIQYQYIVSTLKFPLVVVSWEVNGVFN